MAIRPSQPDPQARANLRSEVAAPGFAQLERLPWPQSLGQPSATLQQLLGSEVLAVDLEQVEDAEDDRIGGHLLAGRSRDPQSLLKPAEGRLVAVEGHHFAVEQQLARPLGRQRGIDLRVGAAEVLAVARLEPDLVAGLARDAALAVEFALQQPVLAEIAAIGQSGEHQGNRHTRSTVEWSTVEEV